MKRANFLVLKSGPDGDFYKEKVSGVEFEIQTPQPGKTLTIRAYIDERIHRMFFIDPDTGVAFADYTFPFEQEFDREKHLQHATLYLDADMLAGYILFHTQKKDIGTSNAAVTYKKLQEEYEKAGIREI